MKTTDRCPRKEQNKIVQPHPRTGSSIYIGPFIIILQFSPHYQKNSETNDISFESTYKELLKS